MSKQPKRSHKQADSYRRRKPLNLFQSHGDEPKIPLYSNQNQSQRVDELVKLGIQAFQARRLADAVGYLTNALALAPHHALAHNCLGIVRRAQGDVRAAIACYERALECEPDYAEAHNNLGVACEASGNIGRATLAYQAALRNRPKFAAALNNLGNVLTKQGRPQEAVDQLQQAIREQPGFAAAHNNLGLALVRLEQTEEAERCFRRALEYQPNFPEAYVNLGNALRARKELATAEDCYHQALRIRRICPAALSGLGNVRMDQRQPDEARAYYEQAVQADANFAEAHFGCGNVYLELEQWEKAIASLRRAVQCDPNYAEAFNNLGGAFGAMRRLDEAEQAYRDAIRVDPDMVAAYNNLGILYRLQNRTELAAEAYREVIRRRPDRPLAKLRISTLCPTVFGSQGEMAEYFERVHAEWSSMRGECAYSDLPELLTVANEAPYNLQFFAENVRPLREAYAGIFRYSGPSFHGQRSSGKIRIGCMVTAGHEIAFLRLFWDSLRRMNRDEFEVTIVCAAESVEKLKTAIQDESTAVYGIPDQPHKILHAIRQQRFDILHYFEICTDIRNYFLPFFRLAPVQVTSWGIQVTSGIPNVDYYLSSDLVEAPEANEHYSEQLVRARTLLTYQQRVKAPDKCKTRAEFGFSDDQHLYVCIQHLGKFHPDYDALLADILRRDPQGKVVGTEDPHGHGAKKLRERWTRDIPDVADRIILLPRLPQAEYLSMLIAGNVLLDPMHFGGVSTTYDGLSLSKPIVTLPTRHHRGRYTAGCYARLGITRCVARDAEEYVQLAVDLGRDREKSDFISAQIRENSWRVFEDNESVREHERIFRELAAKGRAG